MSNQNKAVQTEVQTEVPPVVSTPSESIETPVINEVIDTRNSSGNFNMGQAIDESSVLKYLPDVSITGVDASRLTTRPEKGTNSAGSDGNVQTSNPSHIKVYRSGSSDNANSEAGLRGPSLPFKGNEVGIGDREATAVAAILRDGKVQSDAESRMLKSILERTTVQDLQKINTLLEKSGFRLEASLTTNLGHGRNDAPGYDLVNTNTNERTRIYTQPKLRALSTGANNNENQEGFGRQGLPVLPGFEPINRKEPENDQSGPVQREGAEPIDTSRPAIPQERNAVKEATRGVVPSLELLGELMEHGGKDVFGGDNKLEDVAEEAADRMIESGTLDRETFEQLIKAMHFRPLDQQVITNSNPLEQIRARLLESTKDPFVEDFKKEINKQLKEKGSSLELQLKNEISERSRHGDNIRNSASWKETYSASLVDTSDVGGEQPSLKLTETRFLWTDTPHKPGYRRTDSTKAGAPVYFDYEGKKLPSF